MKPTPEKLAEWRESAELAFPKLLKKHYPHLHTAQQSKGATFKYIDMATEGVWQSFEIGYVRARTEQATEIAELKNNLQFVERWAVHHGTKSSVTAGEALSMIQHYPAIAAITKSYTDGKMPDTFNPYLEIAELKAKLAEVMPLARLGAVVVKAHTAGSTVIEISGYEESGYPPSIISTTNQLLKD